MASFTVATSSPREDNALQAAALLEGQTPKQYVDAWWASLLGGLVDRFVQQRSTQLVAAYLAADQPTRAQINTLLGL